MLLKPFHATCCHLLPLQHAVCSSRTSTLTLAVNEGTHLCHAIPSNPDSKVHGANMGPTWGRQDPGGPNVCYTNFAIWESFKSLHTTGTFAGHLRGDCEHLKYARLMMATVPLSYWTVLFDVSVNIFLGRGNSSITLTTKYKRNEMLFSWGTAVAVFVLVYIYKGVWQCKDIDL